MSVEVVRPKSVAELGDLVRGCEEGSGFVLRGGGTRQRLGNTPRPSAAGGVLRELDLRGLSGIERLEREDGVVQVAAGTPLAELRSACRDAGWELALPVPSARGEGGATVGGAIATAALGARSLGAGPVRDSVLGLDVVLATGDPAKCGGRVVKNVTGYDLAKLYTGSFGRLVAITSAWLRLRAPDPARERRAAELSSADPRSAFEVALAASRLETSAAAALLFDPANPGRARIELELAGDPNSVGSDARSFAAGVAGAGGEERVPTGDDADLEELGMGTAGIANALARARFTGAPSQLASALSLLVDSGVCVACHPGLSVLLVAGRDSESLERLCDEVAGRHGLGLFLEELPDERKAQRDVFQLSAGELRIAESLVARFDPSSRFNPGRYAGRL